MKVDPIYTEAVLALMARPEEFVPASALAPIVKMHPSVIIEYAKNGNWPFCKYVISGNHVKFARIDFLKHFGFIRNEDEKEADPEENENGKAAIRAQDQRIPEGDRQRTSGAGRRRAEEH